MEAIYFKEINTEDTIGYTQKTTFFRDFSVADAFGVEAIRDTYKRSMESYKDNCEYLTELVMVLNWKLWEHFEAGHKLYAKVYDALWKEADQYCMDNLKGEDMDYYLRTTD